MDAFAKIGLPRRLALDDEEIAAAWREAGKPAHPDAGGDEGSFAALRDARATLADPAARLAHWLDLRGVAVEARGSVGPEVMDLFESVAAVTSSAEGLARRRATTSTALGMAVLEAVTLAAREQVEGMIAAVDRAIAAQTRRFAEWDAAPELADPAACALTLRNLRFLQKWRRSLMAAYAGLA